MMAAPDFDTARAKIALDKRLHEEGRHDQFVALREQLKKDGVSVKDAWKVAAKSFMPLNGDPLEIDLPDDMPTIAPEAMPKRVAATKNTAELAVKAKEALDAPKKMLAEKAKQIIDKTCSSNELVMWIINHAAIPAEDIDAEDFPSPAAVKMLHYVQTSDGRYSELLPYWAKTIASQTKIDTGPGFHDDGRLTTVLDTFIDSETQQEALANAESEPEELREPSDAW